MNQEKKLSSCSIIILETSLDLFTSQKKGTALKILTPKQMIQRLPIALAQIKTGNNLESLLNEIS